MSDPKVFSDSEMQTYLRSLFEAPVRGETVVISVTDREKFVLLCARAAKDSMPDFGRDEVFTQFGERLGRANGLRAAENAITEKGERGPITKSATLNELATLRKALEKVQQLATNKTSIGAVRALLAASLVRTGSYSSFVATIKTLIADVGLALQLLENDDDGIASNNGHIKTYLTNPSSLKASSNVKRRSEIVFAETCAAAYHTMSGQTPKRRTATINSKNKNVEGEVYGPFVEFLKLAVEISGFEMGETTYRTLLRHAAIMQSHEKS